MPRWILLILFVVGCSRHDLAPTVKSDLLLGSQKTTISLGTVLSGKQASKFLAVENNSDASIKLTSVETSCPCVKVADLPSIPAHGTNTLKVDFDSTEEPDFHGDLGVVVTLKDSGGGNTKFTMDVTIQ